MKNQLRKEISGLLNSEDEIQDILVVTCPEAVIYYFRDMKLNRKQLEELKKKYRQCVILKPKIYY